MDTSRLVDELNARISREHSQRVQRGMLARAKDGLPTGTVPLGYRMRGRRVLITQPAAGIIAEAFRWIGEEGLPVRTAWRRATAAGLLSRRGKPLSASAFQLIVNNPFYAGFVRFGGELHKGSHTTLISPELFRRMHERVSIPFV